MGIDTAWYLQVNQLARATPTLHRVLAAYALWAGLVLLVALLVLAWWRARLQADPAGPVAVTILTGLATVVALLVNQNVISELIARPRPCATLPGVEVLLTCSADYSMPSDHTVIAGALAAGLWLTRRALLAGIGTVLALAVAFARVYVGVHYPSDTLVGLLVGAAITVVIVLGLRPAAARVADRVTHTRWAFLVTARATPT